MEFHLHEFIASLPSAQLPILPVLLPAFTAMLLLLIGGYGGGAQGLHATNQLLWARRIALLSVAVQWVIAWLIVLTVRDLAEPMVYRLGDWPAPYGIVLVVDRLSALMLALNSSVALAVLLYATGGWDAHGRNFHPLFQFQLMGLSGAFVTGDLFNLFVFFEVLLIASYALLLHGQGAQRFRAGVHYVILNLAASALFLIGVSLLYSQVGTLNLADLAIRVPQATGGSAKLVQVAGLMLLVVFGFKAALMPLALWLPSTYASASTPIAALFAIMTKVGVYAIIRVHGVVFGDSGGDSALIAQDWLLPLALITSVIGVLGALAAHTLPRLTAWLTVASVGTILTAMSLYDVDAWSAGLYYLLNSTLVVAALFMLSELVAAQRGDAADRLVPASPVAQPTLLGLMLLLAAASVAGLPPLPGFIGKLMLLEASAQHAWSPAIWAVVLIVGFLTLVGLARAGAILFWNTREDTDDVLVQVKAGASPRLLTATLSLIVASVAMSVFAEPLKAYTDRTAAQLTDRAGYARAVLGAPDAQTTRPYDGQPPKESH